MRALGWALAAAAVSAWLALVEVLWLPLRVGGVLVPVSVLAAVVGNVLLVGAAHRLSGSRLVGVVPAVVWLVVAVGGSLRRPEGDVLVAAPTGDTLAGVLNLVFLLAGVVAASFAVGRLLGAGPAVAQDPARR